MKTLPDSPPTWLRLLAVISAIVGGSIGVLAYSLATNPYTAVYTVTRKYISEPDDGFRIFSEVFPGGSSLDSSYSKGFFDSATRGDTLTVQGNGLRTLSRDGKVKFWEIDGSVRFSVLFTVLAFFPIVLLWRYRNAWVRCVCYGTAGVGAAAIILFSIWYLFSPLG